MINVDRLNGVLATSAFSLFTLLVEYYKAPWPGLMKANFSFFCLLIYNTGFRQRLPTKHVTRPAWSFRLHSGTAYCKAQSTNICSAIDELVVVQLTYKIVLHSCNCKCREPEIISNSLHYEVTISWTGCNGKFTSQNPSSVKASARCSFAWLTGTLGVGKLAKLSLRSIRSTSGMVGRCTGKSWMHSSATWMHLMIWAVCWSLHGGDMSTSSWGFPAFHSSQAWKKSHDYSSG